MVQGLPDPLRSRSARGRSEASPATAEEAFQVLVDREWAPMVRLATLLLDGDSRRGEEVVQDALLGLHRAWWRLAERERGGGYLRRSVVNGCRDVHRHRAVERRHLGVVRDDDDALAALPSPEDHAAAGAEHDRLARVLRRLPDRQREVLVLRYWLDLSEAEIARTLHVSRGAVKTHASRGLAAVRAALEEEHDA